MKINANIFWIIGVFFIAALAFYSIVAEFNEPIGMTMILVLVMFAFMLAWYSGKTAKASGQVSMDDEEGEIKDYAGTYGNFAPWSWWPLGLGAGAALLLLGIAVGWWIFYIAIGVSLFFVVGWSFEFSKGDHAH